MSGVLKNYADQFHDKFQAHVLAVCARAPGFVVQYRTALNAGYFSDQDLSTIARALFAHVDKYRILPQRETLATEAAALVGEDDREKIGAKVRALWDDNITDAQAVQDKAIEFGKHQALVGAVLAAADDITAGKADKVSRRIQDALLVGQDLVNLGLDYHDPESRRERYLGEEVEGLRITTGFTHLDYVLRGGLRRGTLGVVLAPAKKGKSTVLINLGYGALTEGFNVVHYSLEMDQDEISERYDDRVMGHEGVKTKVADEQYVGRVQTFIGEQITGGLLIRRYPTRSLSVAMIRGHISLLRANDFHPDLVIVDYADIMKPERRLGEMRHEQAGIYEDLRQLAGEENVAVWTASQSNKASLEKETLTIADFAESFEKAAIADAILGFCLPYNQAVVTDRGPVKIGGIGKRLKRGPLHALSHNFETGLDEWKPIVNWFSNGEQPGGKFIRVTLETAGRSHGTTTTPDHEFFHADGTKVRAADVRVGDVLQARTYVFSPDQEQVLLGSLLGDGYISKECKFTEEHGATQRGYLRWKLDAFAQPYSGMASRDLNDAFGQRRVWQGWVGVTLAFKRARARWYATGRKRIPCGALSNLTPLGLAVWIMDDGTVDKQSGVLTLHCQGFDAENWAYIQRYFEATYGAIAREYRGGRLQFTAASSRKLLAVVSDYLVPSSRPRVTKTFKFPIIEKGSVAPALVRVLAVTPITLATRRRYDIEVADNHNFYTPSGALVSNCQTDEEKMAQTARLFCAGIRGAEDGRTIECALRREACQVISTGLFDAAYSQIILNDDPENTVKAVASDAKTRVPLDAARKADILRRAGLVKKGKKVWKDAAKETPKIGHKPGLTGKKVGKKPGLKLRKKIGKPKGKKGAKP